MSLALFLLAILAILAAWLPLGRVGRLVLAGLLAMVGIATGTVSLTGIFVLMVLLGLAWRFQPEARGWAGAIFALLALCAGFNLLPAFETVLLFGPEPVKPDSEPYQRGVNPGLVAITLLLLAMHPLAGNRRELAHALGIGVLVGLLTAIPALGAGWLLGGLAGSPGFPAASFMALWLGGQLLTLAMEEGFFRGFVQRHLARRLPASVAIISAGILFGLAHFAGGLAWIAGASVAGIGYGIAYHASGGRLEASMAAHLTVNLLHLGLFSYPMLSSR